jgi:hypothetical protein
MQDRASLKRPALCAGVEPLPIFAASLGSRLIACTADAPTPVFDSDVRGEVGFVIRVEVKSLTAAAAATFCFYEWGRQTGAGLPQEPLAMHIDHQQES